MKFYKRDSSLRHKIGATMQLRPATFNSELAAIYDDCKPLFMYTFQKKYPKIRSTEIEEIYDDAIMAFYNNVTAGKLIELTCSIQTYVNRIGENKIIDLCRKRKLQIVSLSESADTWCSKAKDVWDSMDSDSDREKKNVVLNIVENMPEPCKTILSYYYYLRYNLALIAKKTGLKDSNSAKTTKNRCMNKLRDTTHKQFKTLGLA